MVRRDESTYDIVGSSHEEILELLDRMVKLSAKEVLVVRVPASHTGHSRVVEVRRTTGTSSIVVDCHAADSPDARLLSLRDDSGEGSYPLRFYLDNDGRPVLRARGLDDAVDFLTVALPRLLVDKVDLVQKVRAAPLLCIPERRPLVVSMRVRLNLVYGAVAKAGLNLVVKLYGADFAREPAFTDVRQSVMGELGDDFSVASRFVRVRAGKTPFDRLPPGPDLHWMGLFATLRVYTSVCNYTGAAVMWRL